MDWSPHRSQSQLRVPTQMALPALVSPSHRRGPNIFKASNLRLGSFLSSSNDATETGGSDLSAGYLKLLQWGDTEGLGF